MIGSYTFERKAYKGTRQQNFQFAYYIGQSGERAIAKIWQGHRKDANYFWLKNEAAVNSILSKVTKLGNGGVYSPALLHVQEDRYSLALLFDAVSGGDTMALPLQDRFEIYERIMDYLRNITESMRDEDKKTLKQRGVFYQTMSLPLFGVLAVLRQPRSLGDIIRALRYWPSILRGALRGQASTLVHRDLTSGNILQDGRQIVVLDFELAAYAHPFMDIAGILLGNWEEDGFWDAFRGSRIVRPIIEQPVTRDLLRGVVLHHAISNLAVAGKRHKNRNAKFLRFALNNL